MSSFTMEALLQSCGSFSTEWHVPDASRDETFLMSLHTCVDATSLQRTQVVRTLAESALAVHETHVTNHIASKLPNALYSIHIDEQSTHEVEAELISRLETIGDTIQHSVESLKALSKILGDDTTYINSFLKHRIQATAETNLPRSANTILNVILTERFTNGDRTDVERFCRAVSSIGLHPMALDAAWDVISTALKAQVSNRCDGQYEEAALEPLMEWMDSHALPFLQQFISPTGVSLDDAEVKYWRSRLEYQLLHYVAGARIREMFDIVIDYPDSEPVLDDLKKCLLHTDMSDELAGSLQKQLDHRLLHPGAQTADIISQYINLVRALHKVDPRGVIVERVCEPIRAYLRRRSDTIRCIVSGVTEENGDLMKVLENTVNTETATDSEDDEDFERWEPLPADASLEESVSCGSGVGSGDPLARLFDIYGSREVFADEYRKMLGTKLIFSEEVGGEVDREIRNVEMLKVRFGSEAMQNCAVMLKDVADTRRIISAANKASAEDDKPNSEFIIISRHCWPKVQETDMPLPDMFHAQCKRLTEEFERIKAPRKLRWQPQLGAVKLVVTLDNGRQIRASVTPLQAALLSFFEEKKCWKVEELAEVLKCPVATVKTAASQWIGRGLLKEVEGNSLEVVETVEDDMGEGGEHGTEQNDRVGGDDGNESMEEAQSGSDMKVYESFVLGMLTNLDKLTLDRIHNMLKMFCVNPSFDKTLDQLQGLLDDLIAEDKITVSGREYSLRRPS